MRKHSPGVGQATLATWVTSTIVIGGWRAPLSSGQPGHGSNIGSHPISSWVPPVSRHHWALLMPWRCASTLPEPPAATVCPRAPYGKSAMVHPGIERAKCVTSSTPANTLSPVAIQRHSSNGAGGVEGGAECRALWVGCDERGPALRRFPPALPERGVLRDPRRRRENGTPGRTGVSNPLRVAGTRERRRGPHRV